MRNRRPPALDFEIAAELPAPDSFGAITKTIFEARRNGSRFLNDAEWRLLRNAAPFWPEARVLTHCAQLRKPWRLGLPKEVSRIVLLDARALQTPSVNGSKNHALAVARALVHAMPPDYSIAFLTSPAKPPLAEEIAHLATATWRPAQIGDVAIFVQLVTLTDPLDASNIDLLRAPWIRRISVFLDDIQGIYPEHFIGTSHQFWTHQLAIEKLRSSHVVLSLGATSQNEAIALWNSLGSELAPPQFLISGCISGLPKAVGSDGLTPSRDFIVFGNHYPHKNIALVAAAVTCVRPSVATSPNFVFVAEVNSSQREALTELASLPDNSKNAGHVEFLSGLTSLELSRRLSRARAAVIPSFHEGFSLPVIEALERGVPVVLSRIPAHLELLDDGPWFFDPDSVASLCSALEACDVDRDGWIAQQRASLASRYSPETLATSVTTVLSSLTNNVGPLASVPLRDEPGAARPQPRRAKNSRVVIEARDREFMGLVFDSQRSDTQLGRGLASSSSTIRVSHDSLVSEFHNSRTWRIGRFVVGPAHWLRRLFVGASK